MKSLPVVFLLLTIVSVGYSPLVEVVEIDPVTHAGKIADPRPGLVISTGLSVAVLLASVVVAQKMPAARAALLALVMAANGCLLAINLVVILN
ncbi:MAG TPA: hypothetical protein VGF55_31585 [Gemmataceae bacterium]|jgi:hypothetical protein